jgi:hypothetical protein
MVGAFPLGRRASGEYHTDRTRDGHGVTHETSAGLDNPGGGSPSRKTPAANTSVRTLLSKLRDQCFKGALCDRTFFALHVPRLSCRADTKSITLLLAALGAGVSRFCLDQFLHFDRIRSTNPPSGRGVFSMHCRHDLTHTRDCTALQELWFPAVRAQQDAVVLASVVQVVNP